MQHCLSSPIVNLIEKTSSLTLHKANLTYEILRTIKIFNFLTINKVLRFDWSQFFFMNEFDFLIWTFQEIRPGITLIIWWQEQFLKRVEPHWATLSPRWARSTRSWPWPAYPTTKASWLSPGLDRSFTISDIFNRFLLVIYVINWCCCCCSCYWYRVCQNLD